MKKTWFQRLIPLLLVASFLISTAEPVAAATITGDVAPSGVVDLSDCLSSSESLPDRSRFVYTVNSPEDNFFWATGDLDSKSAKNVLSYDLFSTTLMVDEGYSSSYPNYLNIYPSGRSYLKLPFSVSLFSTSDVNFTFNLSCYSYRTTSGGYTYYKGLYVGSKTIYISCYDEDFNLLGNKSVSATSYSSSAQSSSPGYTVYPISFEGTFSFPAGTVYIVPYLYFSLSDVMSYTHIAYFSNSSMSFNLSFDVMSDLTVSGIWEAKSSSPTVKDSVTEKVNFTSGGIQYDTMEYSYRAPTGNQRERHNLSYIAGENTLIARSDGWQRDCSKVVDFGSEPQKVSPQYYAFLTDHFTRISDSPEYGTPVNLKIYDYSGDTLLASCDTSRQVYLALNAAFGSTNDFFVFEPGMDNVWSDDDELLASVGFEYSDALITGVSLSRYGPPIDMEEITDSYLLATLYSGAELYLIREGDEVPEGGSSGSEGEEGWFNLYDYDGETLIDQFWVTFPVTVKVKEDGFHLIDYQEDVSSWQYVYDGDGTYAGLTYGSADSDRFLFTPGTGFVLSSESSIYLTCKDDLTNSDSSGGSGGSDASGDDSGGSSGDGSGGLGDLDGSGVGDSAGDLSGAGDQLGDVIGDANDISGQLPDFPDDLAGIISDHLTNFYDSPILGLMPWNDGEYGYVWDFLFAPTLTTLSVSLLLYFVFGKAEAK